MLQKITCESYKNLFEKEKNKKYQYACKQYRNRFVENEPSEEEKNRKHQCAREQYGNLSKQKNIPKVSICLRKI